MAPIVRTTVVDRKSIAAVLGGLGGLIQFIWCVSEANSRYSRGFSFSRSFLSDMGRTDAPAWVLFNGSVIVVGVNLIALYVFQNAVVQICIRWKIGEDSDTFAYIHRLETRGLTRRQDN